MVLLPVLVVRPTDEGYHAYDLDKGTTVEKIWVVGGEKGLPVNSCEFYIKYFTDIVWRGLDLCVQETHLVITIM